MLLSCLRVDYYIIEIYKAYSPLQLSQCCLHESLERGRRILQPEWHNLEMEEAFGTDECSHVTASWIHFNLPIPTIEVKGREDG